MIKATHLSKRYGAKTALYDVNFSIGKGEVVGFLGPNGAGKSTTMNLLCGYLEPTWGRVEIAGADMALQPLEGRRHIGYLPEIPPLYMDMTVGEQLSFACDLRGLAHKGGVRRDYIDALCRRTELLDVRDRLIWRRTVNGVPLEEARYMVDNNDLPNVRLCMERSMEGDLTLRLQENGDYVLAGGRLP